MTTLLTKYGAVLLPALLSLLGALQLFLADDLIDTDEGGQIIALIAGLFLTYFLPLVKGNWAGLLKTGAQVLVAISMLIIPLIMGGFDINSLIAFCLVLFNALATEIGVKARKDPNIA